MFIKILLWITIQKLDSIYKKCYIKDVACPLTPKEDDKNMICYHFTRRESVVRILNEGLRPSSKTGNRSVYGGLSGNHDYLYFYSEESIKRIARNFCLGFDPKTTIKNMVLLQGKIDNSLLERDYDQLLVFLEYAKRSQEWREWLIKKTKRWGTTLNGFNEKEARLTIDAMSEDSWRSMPGSYRTTEKQIGGFIIIPWKKFLSLRLRFIGLFVRPYFKIKTALKEKH